MRNGHLHIRIADYNFIRTTHMNELGASIYIGVSVMQSVFLSVSLSLFLPFFLALSAYLAFSMFLPCGCTTPHLTHRVSCVSIHNNAHDGVCDRGVNVCGRVPAPIHAHTQEIRIGFLPTMKNKKKKTHNERSSISY